MVQLLVWNAVVVSSEPNNPTIIHHIAVSTVFAAVGVVSVVHNSNY